VLFLDYRLRTAEVLVGNPGLCFAEDVFLGNTAPDGVRFGDHGLGHLLVFANATGEEETVHAAGVVQINRVLDAFLKYRRRLTIPGCRAEHDSGVGGQRVTR